MFVVVGGISEGSLTAALANQDTASVMSFHSSNTASSFASRGAHHHLGTKVTCWATQWPAGIYGMLQPLALTVQNHVGNFGLSSLDYIVC